MAHAPAKPDDATQTFIYTLKISGGKAQMEQADQAIHARLCPR